MDFFHYFLEGMEFIMQDSILFYFQVFLLSIAILWLVRRITILRTGGGVFFPPPFFGGDSFFSCRLKLYR